MRTIKRVLCPQRLRRVPAHFSWIDHRLVRDGYTSRCQPRALALYLLLVCVGDAEGLSYYSDRKAAELLCMNPDELARARRELIEADLIAYQRPLYQVLNLPEPAPLGFPTSVPERPRGGEARPIGEIIKELMGRPQ